MSRTAHHLIAHNELLRSIVEVEPAVLELLEQATICYLHRSRWVAYSALKEACHYLVGWHARDVQLREPHYHETVMAALDVLLPTSEKEGKQIFAHALYPHPLEEEEEAF